VYRRKGELPEALAEHRRREDAAPRLRDEVRRLVSLRLTLEDLRDEGRVVAMSYVKPIVVADAPAYFEIRCMEPRCDGRHDLTDAVMHALRQSKPSFAGRSDCPGSMGDTPCARVLAYSCEATFST
jgi:hypothetical protein